MLMSWRFAFPLFAGSPPCRSAMRAATSGGFSAVLQPVRTARTRRAGRVLRMAVTAPCMGGNLFATLARGSDGTHAASLLELALGGDYTSICVPHTVGRTPAGRDCIRTPRPAADR